MVTEAPPVNGNGRVNNHNPDEPGVRLPMDGQFWEMTKNAFSNRLDYFQQLLDPRRNLDRECGYPSTYAVGPDFYRQLYDRDPIANRVVQLMPKECWQKTPRVYESESGKPTEFEDAWDNLSQQLAPERSWYQDEEGSLVWEYLRRADEISGIGAFGVILLGLDDGMDLREPVQGAVSDKYVRDRDGNKKPTKNGQYRLDPSKLSVATPMPQESVLNEMVENSLTPPVERWKDGGSVGLKHVDQAVVHQAKVDPRFVRNVEGERWELFRDGNVVTNEIKTGSQVVGTDSQYFNNSGYGASVKGTDAQYIGVQLGPTEYPVEKPLKYGKLSLTFVRVFDEALVQIVQYEANIRNPRFGRPVTYRITFNDPREQHSGIGLPVASIYAHWTRIVHLADTGNGVASEIFASPRMRPVLNPLLDGRKISGAGAEGYWQSCFAGVVLSTHPQLGGEVNIGGDTKAVIENYMNGLQRWLVLSGMGASTLAPTVVDPTPHASMQINRICIQLGCPVRVFNGSERGELASSQDDSKWNDRVAHRQNTYVTPRVICPFIDRLILLGVLPEPEGYSVEWPDLDSTTKKDKAAIFLQRTQAYAAAITGNVESLFSPLDMMTKLDDMDEEEAQAVIDAVTKIHEKDMTMTMPPAGAPGHPATVVPPPKPPTPGPTILGPGQTAVPHPGAPGAATAKPFTAPGKAPPGIQVAAAPTSQPPQLTGNKEKFSRPENYDQVKNLGDGFELWVGGNDWENGWNQAWIQKTGERDLAEKEVRSINPVAFMRTNHDNCPGCESDGCDGSWKKCVAYSKPQVFAWAKEQVSKLTHNFFDGACLGCGITENWCNQYGGTTCKEGSAGHEANKTKQVLERKPDFVPKKERESKERINKANSMVKEILDGGKSQKATKELLQHLSTMTTKELKAIKDEHRLKAVGSTKAKLADSLAKKVEGKASSASEAELKDFGKAVRDIAHREQAKGKPFMGAVLAHLLPQGKEGVISVGKPGEGLKGITRSTPIQERWDLLRQGKVSDETLHSILSTETFKTDYGKMSVPQLKAVIPNVRFSDTHDNRIAQTSEGALSQAGMLTPSVIKRSAEDYSRQLKGDESKPPLKAPVDTFRLLPAKGKGRAARVNNSAQTLYLINEDGTREFIWETSMVENSLFTQERFDALADVLCDERVWKGGAKAVRNFDSVEAACFLANSFCPTEPESRIRSTKNAADCIREHVAKFPHYVANAHVFNEEGQDDDAMIEAATQAHDGSEWYGELLQAALQETDGNVALAVKFADEYFDEHGDELGDGLDEDDDGHENDDDDPTDNSNPNHDEQGRFSAAESTQLLKKANEDSLDRETYPRERSREVVASISHHDVKELKKIAKDAGVPVSESSRPKMLQKIHDFLDAGHRAWERIQA